MWTSPSRPACCDLYPLTVIYCCFPLRNWACECVLWIYSLCFCHIVDCKRKRKCWQEGKHLYNLRGLCVRGSLWPDMNIMDSAMWDKRCWLITSPGRCPFLFSSRLSASVFSRVSLYKAAVIIPSVADGEVRAGDLSVWDGHAVITRHWRWQASPQIKRNLPRLDKHLSQTVVWFASLVEFWMLTNHG